MHWAIAVPFMLCVATAAILVLVYNPAPRRPYRALFSWIHRLSGLALAILPLVSAHQRRRDWALHVANVNEAWSWTLDDLRWLARMGLATVSSRVQLPETGKFNAAEKLNFMMVMTVTPLLAVSGLLIWLPGIAFYSWLLHFTLAAAAVPLMLGHVFMATVNPGTRVGLSGMVSGYVDRGWAEHHYPRWYREHFGGPRVPPPDAARPAPHPTPRTVPAVPQRMPLPPG
jgi:formate dehydrogenase gamma subunit